MKATSVHGGGALLDRTSCSDGLLADARRARLVGLEFVMAESPSWSSTAAGGTGEPPRGLGDGLRYAVDWLRILVLFILSYCAGEVGKVKIRQQAAHEQRMATVTRRRE